MKNIKNKLSKYLIWTSIFALFLNTQVALGATSIGSNIATGGNLTVEGTLKFISGATSNYVLRTDASGNATWVSIGTALGNTTADSLPEGATNKYYTDTKVDNRIDLQKAVANGLATLDAGGQIPAGQIPAMAINQTYVVADIAGRNALSANTGDVAIVTDAGVGESRSYIYDGLGWIELLTPLSLYLSKANNLSDIANTATARTNLGLGTGNSPTFNGLTLNGLTSGSLMFAGAGGTASQDNSNLFWDNINKRLGIKNNSPMYALDVNGDIKAGDGSRLIMGSKADPDPAGVDGAMYYNTTSNKFRCYENGAWINCVHSAMAQALSSLTAAIAANSINNGDNAQTWNWSLSTASKAGIEFSENTASSGVASAIAKFSTLAASTAMPLFIENLGDGDSFRVNDSSGDLTPFLIDKDGNVAIGSNSFDPVNPERLKVDSGNTPSFNIITATGNLNNYLQINIKNRNSGNNASSDIVATADNGTEDSNYIDMGINSSGYANSDYSIGGPNDGYLYVAGVNAITPGGNLSIGTGTDGKVIRFHTGGTESTDERMRIDGAGNVGIGTTSPDAILNIAPQTADALRIEPYGAVSGNAGELQFMEVTGAGANYVGLKAPDSIAGNTVWTLPNADGTAGHALTTDGSGNLGWSSAVTHFQRVLTTLSPVNAGDDITTSGDIYTTGTGGITSAGLLVAEGGITANTGDLELNATGTFNTNITTGGATGSVNIGNPSAAAIAMVSGGALTLTGGAASTWSTTTGDITLQAGGSGTTGLVKIGDGGAGSATPDLLALDTKSTTSDPVGGVDGAMYYNKFSNKFRCHINGSWSDCDTTGGTTTLQSAYNSGATITTAGSTDIALTLTSGDFTATGAGAVNLTPTSASSFTSGGALTLTGGASSTWGTTSGDLTLQVAGAGTTANVKIGAGGAGSDTPDLFGLDVKSSAGDPSGYNGAMYYNANSNTFRCYEAGGWKDCGATGAGASTLQQTYNSGATITTSGSVDLAFTVADGDFTVTGAGSVDLTPTSASSFTSGGALTLTGGASSTWGTSAGDLTLQVAGTGTTANVKIGAGGVGSDTPDLFGLDVKSTAGDPAGYNGAMYYNADDGKFRCHEGGSWKDCDDQGAVSLQTAYNSGASITTSGSTPIDFILTSGGFNVSGAGSATLDPTGGVTLGSATSNVNLPRLTASKPVFTDASKNLTSSGTVGIDQGGTGQTTKTEAFDALSPSTTKGDLTVYNGADNVRLPVGSNGQYIIADSTQATGIRWTNIAIANNSLDFAQFSDSMTVDANTSINLAGRNLTINDLTGGGALSLSTNAAALTLTAGAASTWSTGSGNLTIDSAAALNLGTANATSVSIGRSGGGAINLTSPSGVNLHPFGAVAGNTTSQRFLELAANGTNYVGFKAPDNITSNVVWTLPNADGSNGQVLKTDGTGGLSWTTIFTDPMTTRGDIVYRDDTNTTARLAVGTAGQVLKSDGTDIAWSTLSNTDVGLGNVTNDAQIAKSIGTTKGDLIAYSASNTPTRLPVGSNGQYIIADSTQSTGMRWTDLAIANNSLDFAQFSDTMTVDANTSINLAGRNLTINDLTGGGALSLSTNAAALTLTAGAASTWSTGSGNLTIDSAATLNLGTTNATGITLGKAGVTTTNIGPLRVGNATNTGALRIADGSDNFITITSPSIATDYTLTLPVDDGNNGELLSTDGSGNLSWSSAVNYWDRTGTTLSPVTAGDNITSSGNISTTGAGTITSAGLLTATSGVSIGPAQSYTGAGAVTLSSAAATALTINSGTTGNLLIGTDASAETINIGTGAAAKTLTLGSTNTTSSTTIQSGTGGITFTAGPTTSSSNIRIGNSASTTPDLLVLDNGTADPTGTNGGMYYSTNTNKFRCYENGAWKDCDTAGSGGPLTATFTNVTSNAIASRNCSTYATLNFPGVTTSDMVLGVPQSGIIAGANLSWNFYVSAADTVIIEACNPTTGSIDTADTETWRVDVWQ